MARARSSYATDPAATFPEVFRVIEVQPVRAVDRGTGTVATTTRTTVYGPYGTRGAARQIRTARLRELNARVTGATVRIQSSATSWKDDE